MTTKKNNEGFKNSNKCWICDNDFVVDDVEERYHCQITRKYRGTACKDCSINVK